MSSSSGEHGRLGSLKAVFELCIFGPSLFGYNMVVPGPFQRQLKNNHLIFKPNYFITTSFSY